MLKKIIDLIKRPKKPTPKLVPPITIGPISHSEDWEKTEKKNPEEEE